MENNLISVVVPVFNAEKYLWRCYKSIECQTQVEKEIIFIDDGSTDNSLSIIRKIYWEQIIM